MAQHGEITTLTKGKTTYDAVHATRGGLPAPLIITASEMKVITARSAKMKADMPALAVVPATPSGRTPNNQEPFII